MIKIIKHQPTIELLLSLGAMQRPSGGYELDLEMWSKQRESIASSQAGVSYQQRPLLWVTFYCGQCLKLGARRASELAKKARHHGSGCHRRLHSRPNGIVFPWLKKFAEKKSFTISKSMKPKPSSQMGFLFTTARS